MYVNEQSSLLCLCSIGEIQGLMLIGSGIDQKQYQQALEIIMEQVNDMEKAI